MGIEEFKKSLLHTDLPGSLDAYLQSLWYDGKSDWEKAHNLIQDIGDRKAAWIHAYLHRKEGDIGNADYWYNRAGRKRPVISLEEEWEVIVTSLLNGL